MDASSTLIFLMAAIPVAVAGLFAAGVWMSTRSVSTTGIASAGVAALMGIQHAVAASGVLREWDLRPPRLMILLGATFTITVACAFSGIGKKLAEHMPLAWLVGAQGFRLPLELTMHRAVTEGVMPEQMSYSGYNFDILTGATAIVLGVLLAMGKARPGHVRIWNAIGFCLLVNVVGIAAAALPLFARFGPEHLNVWVTYPPFVWLPGVLVPAALLGHLLVWRKLFGSR